VYIVMLVKNSLRQSNLRQRRQTSIIEYLRQCTLLSPRFVCCSV